MRRSRLCPHIEDMSFLTPTQCKQSNQTHCIWRPDRTTLRPLGTSPFVFEGQSRPLFSPHGKVSSLMAMYSTARARILTARTKCHRTSTSHRYLFSTLLLVSAFIYWLFGDFVRLRRNGRQTNRTQRNDSARLSIGRTIKEKGVFFLVCLFGVFFCWMEEHFLVCFYIPWELPSSTYLGSQSQLWAFFWSVEMQIEEWSEKKENWAKERKETKLSSQGHHLKKQNKSSSIKHLRYCKY